MDIAMAMWDLAVKTLERELPVAFGLWWECEQGATPASLALRLGVPEPRVRAVREQADQLVLDLQKKMERLVARHGAALPVSYQRG